MLAYFRGVPYNTYMHTKQHTTDAAVVTKLNTAITYLRNADAALASIDGLEWVRNDLADMIMELHMERDELQSIEK